MSELKAISSGEIYNIIEYEGSCITNDLYYPKSEADKVIDELKQKINEAQTELELWRDGCIISEAHQKELDELLHQKYKRCLAMAKLAVKDDYAPWNIKWKKRWMELAEKFKHENGVNNG